MKVKAIGSNRTEVHTNRGIVLVSYETPVAALYDGEFYRTAKRWSVTTTRHINAWLDGREAQERDQAWFDELI